MAVAAPRWSFGRIPFYSTLQIAMFLFNFPVSRGSCDYIRPITRRCY